MNKPTISIILPCYNVELYIANNVLSMLNQTYMDFEAIYINDGSKDNTLNILNDYAKKDERIKVITTKNYRGVTC